MFASIHTMDGEPQELLARKRAAMDPVVDRLAPAHGAVLSITAPTPDGIVVINLWESAEGAAEFTRHPEALEAQASSGLPAPSSFQRWDGAELAQYTAGHERPGPKP